MGRTSYALLGASLLVSALSVDVEYRGGGGGKSSGGGGGGRGGGGGGGKGGGGKSSSSEEYVDPGVAAQFYGLCVDGSYWYISQDGVDGTYTEIYPAGGRADGWSSVTGFNIDTITTDTVLKVTCAHSGPRMLDDNGLFIGSISYNGEDYYTSNPMSDSLWEVIDTTAGSLDMSVYCPKSGASVQNPCLAWNPSGDAIDGPETKSVIKDTWGDGEEHINGNANWVWNDASENMITFQFRFSRVIGNEAEATGQVMAALVASWQTAKALEWSSVVTLLVMAAFVVALLYAVNECTKNRKDSAYLPIAADEAC